MSVSNRRRMNAILLLMPCVLGLLAAGSVRAADPPNFIVIFCDDQGYQDLGCFGSPNIKTPHIDQLAAQGVRFTDFYSAYCVCSASRAALLTGCYQPRISMRSVLGPHTKTALHPDEITIADMLRTKGYATAMVGKWHVGDTPETLPTSQGFDSYFGLPYSNDMARKKGWGNNAPDLDKIWAEKRWDIYNNELYRDKGIIESPVNQETLTKRYTEESVKFIRRNQDRPFFLYLAHAMPHVPLFVPEDDFDRDPSKAYRLTIEHIDWSVGQITNALDELGIAKNTMIVYTSDNGPWLSKEHHGGSAWPLRAGKGTTYEGGMRVPCVMRWPARIEAGGTCAGVASTIDLLPTFAALVGAELPADRPIDGLDITSLLDDPTETSPHDRDGFFYYKNNKLEAVRLGNWKLHLKGQPELYDLRSDISEARNVADTHKEFSSKLKAFAETYDADLKANTRPAWTAAPATPGQNQARGRGFKSLYNGKDLTGWKTKGNWLPAEDGVLAIQPRPGEKGWQRYDAYLWAERPYANFILELEFKIPPGGNSGVFVRVKDPADPVKTGIEVQILDSYDKGDKLGPHDNGGVIGTVGPSKNMSRPAGQWNRMIVQCRGTRMKVELNGEQIVDLKLDESAAKDRPLTGYIGLQDHGLPLWFRNIRVKELK